MQRLIEGISLSRKTRNVCRCHTLLLQADEACRNDRLAEAALPVIRVGPNRLYNRYLVVLIHEPETEGNRPPFIIHYREIKLRLIGL